MVSRRDALKLGAAGLALPTTRLVSSPDAQGSNSSPNLLARRNQETLPANSTLEKSGIRFDQPIVVKWKLDVDQSMPEPGIVHNDMLLVGTGPETPTSSSDDGTFWALEKQSGEIIWSYPGQATWWSTPIVIDDTIYVSSALVGYNYHHSEYHAFDLLSGEERWRHDFEGAVNTSTSAIGDILIVSTEPADPYGPGESGTYALTQGTGDVVWSLPYSLHTSRPHSKGTQLQISGDMIFHTSRDGLSAIDAKTGNVVWSSPESYDHLFVLGDHLIACPRGGAFQTGLMSGFDINSGTELWRMEGVFDSIGATNGLFVTGSLFTNEIVWLDPATGKSTISAPLDGAINNVVRANDVMYLVLLQQPDNMESANLRAVDMISGDILWTVPAKGSIDDLSWTNDLLLTVGGETVVNAVDAITGQLIWSQDMGEFSNRPRMTAIDTATFLYTYSGDLFALNNENGSILFSLVIPGGTGDGPIVDEDLWFFGGEWNGPIFALGNLSSISVVSDTTLRAAPHPVGVEMSQIPGGSEVEYAGRSDQVDGTRWIEVRFSDHTGWIPADSIDPATLPPEGDIEYIYVP